MENIKFEKAHRKNSIIYKQGTVVVDDDIIIDDDPLDLKQNKRFMTKEMLRFLKVVMQKCYNLGVINEVSRLITVRSMVKLIKI
jgi:hypothetical protein